VWRSLVVAERNLCFIINSFLQFFIATWTVVELIASPAIVTLTVPQATLEQTVRASIVSFTSIFLHLLQHETYCRNKSLNNVSWGSGTPIRAPRICKRRIIPERYCTAMTKITEKRLFRNTTLGIPLILTQLDFANNLLKAMVYLPICMTPRKSSYRQTGTNRAATIVRLSPSS
jgi:hypothetical protein